MSTTTTIVIPSIFTSADAAEYIAQEIQNILEILNGASDYCLETDDGPVWVSGRLSAGALALSLSRVAGDDEVWDLIYPIAKMLESGDEEGALSTLDAAEDAIIAVLSQSADKLRARLRIKAVSIIGEEYLELYMATYARRDFENDLYWLKLGTPAGAFWHHSRERLDVMIGWADREFCQNGAYIPMALLCDRERFDSHVLDGKHLLDYIQKVRRHLAAIKVYKEYI